MLELFRLLFACYDQKPVTVTEEQLLAHIREKNEDLLPSKANKWIVARLAEDGQVTFHRDWLEHQSGRAYCRLLSEYKICKYKVDDKCVTITLSSLT